MLKHNLLRFGASLGIAHKVSFYMPMGIMKFFDLHEYQSKYILKKHGLNVQESDLATTPEEAREIATRLNGKFVLKAQVHAGGRGKGRLTSGLKGGVQLCHTPEDAFRYAKQMIGYNLITHQTVKEGLPVKSLLVEGTVDVKKEFYLAIVLDRKNQSPVVVACNEGGMDIEEVAKRNPSAIKVFPVNVLKGISDDTVKEIVDVYDFENEEQKAQARDQVKKLYHLFVKTDSTQVEINPWALDKKGNIYFLDAKFNIDESAHYRQKEIMDMKAHSKGSETVDENEEKAAKHGLSYIGLDGNIACLVNGAGLAMATMDIIKLKGAEPANFLDVGGGATEDQVAQAFSIIKSHPKVKAILVNIFGGIMRCDIIAKGIIGAVKRVGLDLPLVIRLTGTNADLGKKILNDFSQKTGTNFITANNLDDAAEKAVKSVKH